MKNEQRKSTNLSALFFILAAFTISSCNKNDDDFAGENSQTANNESAQESTSDELDDMATVALNSTTSAGGRSETISDDRFCADTNISVSGKTITINFGATGCTDKKGNVRKGQIVITWTGDKWYLAGSSYTITLVNYSINDVGISGTRTITATGYTYTDANTYSITWNVVADNAFTWPDNTNATRKVTKTKKWDHTATEDTYTVSNTAGLPTASAGTNRHGNLYTVSINTPLVYLGSCVKANKAFFPVSGVKVITFGLRQRTLTLDYGTGTCDNSFTATIDGKSKSFSAKNDSSAD